MDVKRIGALVDQANESLLETCRFPEGWRERYQSELRALAHTYQGATWPKGIFAALHYASTFLCLRYHASSIAKRDPVTKAVLGDVQLQTDVFLWSEAGKLPNWTADAVLENDTERRLVSLCFGKCSPVDDLTTNAPFAQWREAYLECVRALQERLKQAGEWNKWVCVALHFASFYLDLYRQRTVDLGSAGEHRLPDNVPPALRASLASRIESRRVRRLIELWLNATAVDRDGSGIPKLGNARPGMEQCLSVRTPTEVLIQLSSRESGESGKRPPAD